MTLTALRPTVEERTKLRWRAHHWLSTRSVRVGAGSCMHPLKQGTSTVAVSRTAGGVLHVGGVQRCASVHACPGCAPVIRERRAGEIDVGVARALLMGWTVVFVTATASHALGDHLGDVRRLVHGAWTATWSSGPAERWRERTGYRGQIRVSETTYGENGWHPHIHAALFFDRPVTDSDLLALGIRYSLMVTRRGGASIVPGVGWDTSTCTESGNIAGYLTKVEGGWGVGQELARGDLKSGRRKGLSPFELLAMAVDGDHRAAILFRIYEEATYGKRAIVWSAGLKAELAVPEVSDEELADQAPDEAIEARWIVPAVEWAAWVRSGRLGAALAWFRTAPPPTGGIFYLDWLAPAA